MSQTSTRTARFAGKVAIVTGAGSGMGAAMVRGLHAEGAEVVAVDVDGARVERVAAALADDGRVRPAALDVSDGDAVAALVADVAGRGRIDVLCNNAGILDDYVPAHEASPELWQRILAVNLTGPFLLARAVVPTMLEQGAGAIVNTCSIAAFVGGGGGAAYTTSKHGLLGLTRQLAFDYGRHGIRVNAVCPGAVATGMTTELRTPEQANAHVDAAIAATPAGRWGEPEEVAALALFLASDEASFIHGTPVLVDGGWTLS
ncbi:SDR family NAD(P)-dependent oxidoreductase [Patulibacter defluvii]|uniref:SDR family NAD(P)-dependent oxidoreductase n=1 Tax=Patulibacter defluvii TaxID=3095358 RepID=UPI002A752D4A|nr:glucose 1-dehydrogenase [Patulibacter sp. DM4]